MRKNPSNIELYIAAAKKLGLTTEKINSGKRSPLLISDGKKITFINTGSPGFYPEVRRWNASLSGSKILSQTILKKLGYKTIKTDLIRTDLFDSAKVLADSLRKEDWDFPVLIKPNHGSDGANIKIVEDVNDLTDVSVDYFEEKSTFLIQPIIRQTEYRILVINDSVELVHSKENQYLTGDGKSTIAEQLKNIKLDRKDSAFIDWQYKKLNLSPKSVLPEGQKFELHLTKIPSTAYYKTSDFDPEMEKWALHLAKAISAPVVGIDVFVSESISDPSSYTIIELNSNPAVYYLPKRCNDTVTGPRIVEKVLKDYFNITQI